MQLSQFSRNSYLLDKYKCS